MLKRSGAVQEPSWWPLALRGVAAAIVGVLVLGLQGHRMTLLFGVYGGYMAVDGAIELVIAARSIVRHERWWQTMLSGLVGVVFGLANIAGKGMSPVFRLYLVAARFAVNGLVQLRNAKQPRADQLSSRLLRLSGIGGIGFGILLVVALLGLHPIVLIDAIGVYSILFGGLMLWLAARLRQPSAPAAATLPASS